MPKKQKLRSNERAQRRSPSPLPVAEDLHLADVNLAKVESNDYRPPTPVSRNTAGKSFSFFTCVNCYFCFVIALNTQLNR